MTNNTNNNTHHKDLLKALIFITGAAVAFYSATLTYQFMSGLSPTLGSIGILFEVVKFFLPMIALFAFKTGAVLRGYLLSAIGLMLVAMSFTASFIAVDAGFDDNRKQSAEFLALNQKIDLLSVQASEIRNQANALPFDDITKRSQLNDQAVSIENNMASLIGDRASLRAGSIADQFGKYIAIAAAVIIELLTVSTTVAISLLSATVPNVTRKDTKIHNQTPTPTAPVIEPVTVFHREPNQVKHVTFQAKNNIEQEIKEAVITKVVKPSVRGVRAAFNGISNERISNVLKDLYSAGFLVQKGQGFTYAYLITTNAQPS